MNKSELIENLAESLDLPLREAAAICDTILQKMADALTQGENID